MKKQVYEIGENGYIVRIGVKEFGEEGNCIEELADNIITIKPPDGLYRAKWNGEEWVEDMTLEDIDALNNVVQAPSELEELSNYVLDVDFRVVMLEVGL